MRRLKAFTGAVLVFLSLSGAQPRIGAAQAPPSGALQRINLAEQLASEKLRAVNRQVARLPEKPDAVRLTEAEGPGVVWIDGTDFAEGTIEIDVRGRDVIQRSFVGVAFHRRDDTTYESVYLRPFNFRIADPARRQNAVQYMTVPDFDWPRLRQEFASEFENPVDPSVSPTDWVPLRIVVLNATVQVFVGTATTPALEARKLGQLGRGTIGLWAGNNSDGDFANLRVTPAK